MSELLPPLAGFSFDRKLSGTTRVLLAFAAGTLFALLPLYYLYTNSGAARRAAPRPEVPELPAGSGASRAEITDGGVALSSRFAARMTYELSQTPEEPPAMTARFAAAPQPAESTEETRPAAGPSADQPARRVSNARPISPTPPDLRDTTGEIEKESRWVQPRAPSGRQSAKAPVEPVQPRVFEGRPLVLPQKPPSVATRSIDSNAPSGRPDVGAEPNRRLTDSAIAFLAAQDRKQIEARSVIAGAGAGAVGGVSPIGPPPEAQQRGESAQKPTAPENARGAAADAVESRLAATREWLNASPQTTHTIQLLGASSEEQLKAQLKILSKVLEPDKIYVFRTIAQGKPAMTVVYGAYSDRQSALQALEKLPPIISANRPVLRTVSGIRTEMKQHGISGDS